MRWRISILASLLLVLFTSFLVIGVPEFRQEGTRSITLNPEDKGIVVQELSVGKVASPIRVKELTVKNYGTASGSELSEIQIRYRKESGSWQKVSLGSLSGINTGITFTLPGDGVDLKRGERGFFQVVVSVAEPANIPVSKSGNAVSLELGTMLHYVYQEETGEAVDSVSSNWITDSAPDVIARAGFEEARPLSLERGVLQGGTTVPVGRYVFRDADANQDGVEVEQIVVENRAAGEGALIFGRDISQLRLNLRIEEAGEVVEKAVTRSIAAPIDRLTISTPEDGWWNGRCVDGCRIELEVMGKIEPESPAQGARLRTEVTLTTKETNGMAGYPFEQAAVVPDSGALELVIQGLEKIEDITEWESGVVNQGEKFKQRLTLSDDDPDGDDFIVKSIKLENEGSLRNGDIEEISAYRVQSDGSLAEVGDTLSLSSSWQALDFERGGRIPDDGRGVFEIHYQVSDDAKKGATLAPSVRFRGSEAGVDNVLSPVLEPVQELTVYPWGAEKMESNRDYGGSPAGPSGHAILAQRIDMMDKDENRLDLFTNPIVIQNTAEATAGAFTKLELYDSRGNLLVEKTDLSGLTTAGVTLDNLNGKTTVSDNQAGNWRSFFIFLTPRSMAARKSVDLRTTLYQTEGERDNIRVLQGPSFTTGRRSSGSSTTVSYSSYSGDRGQTATTPIMGGIDPRVGIAIAGAIAMVAIFLLSR